MKKIAILIACILLSCHSKTGNVPDTSPVDAAAEASPDPNFQAPRGPTYKVSFSPQGGCTQLIQDHIGSATKSIHMQAYGFTSKPIADALIAAQARGIDVELILDKSNLTDRYSQMQYVQKGKVSVFIDAKHPIAHNKVIIVDKSDVQTGSFNYTEAAEERNAENCLIVHSIELNGLYMKNWQAHKDHADPAPAITQ